MYCWFLERLEIYFNIININWQRVSGTIIESHLINRYHGAIISRELEAGEDDEKDKEGHSQANEESGDGEGEEGDDVDWSRRIRKMLEFSEFFRYKVSSISFLASPGIW